MTFQRKDINPFVNNLIHNTVFMANPPGIFSGQFIFQKFRLPGPSVGVLEIDSISCSIFLMMDLLPDLCQNDKCVIACSVNAIWNLPDPIGLYRLRI